MVQRKRRVKGKKKQKRNTSLTWKLNWKLNSGTSGLPLLFLLASIRWLHLRIHNICNKLPSESPKNCWPCPSGLEPSKSGVNLVVQLTPLSSSIEDNFYSTHQILKRKRLPREALYTSWIVEGIVESRQRGFGTGRGGRGNRGNCIAVRFKTRSRWKRPGLDVSLFCAGAHQSYLTLVYRWMHGIN